VTSHLKLFQPTTLHRLFAGFVALFSGIAMAQLPPLGGETLVNANSSQFENEPSVAMDAAGNYAVAFSRFDGTNNGIGIQRFFRNGTPNGALILPHASNNTPVQADASIAMADDGRFVVVWEDNGNRGGTNNDVKFALYSASGSSVASGTVNTTLSGVRENARVAINRATGEFVVVFVGGGNQATVDSYYRRYNASGTPLDSTEKQVNTAGAGRTSIPSVALASNGNFIVAWEGDPGGDDMWEAYFQRYTFGTASATAQGSNTVASASGHDTTNVDVACDNSGNFVLTWVDGLPSSSTDPHDVLFRIYNAAGAAANNTPQVIKAGAYGGNGDMFTPRPRVAMASDRSFVVTYLHNDEIWGRFYNATGAAQGAEIHVNTTTNATQEEYQTKPWVAMNPHGNRATFVWSGTGTPDSNGIYMQRFAAANTAPVLATIGNKTAPEMQALTFTANATELPANFGDTITYSLVGAPTGASINVATGAFTWTPTEAQGPGSYNMKIVAMDNGEPSMYADETFTITVTEVNTPPTALQLSSTIVQNHSPVGTVIGAFSAVDTDLPAQALTYSLVSGIGDADNGKFTIAGNQLKVAVPPDIASQTAMYIRVQVSDSVATADVQFVLTVLPAASVDTWQLY